VSYMKLTGEERVADTQILIMRLATFSSVKRRNKIRHASVDSNGLYLRRCYSGLEQCSLGWIFKERR
jgi:hypothetical protein